MAGDSIDAFLKFGDGWVGPQKFPQIAGETTDKKYRDEGWMQIRNYTFDFTMQTEGSEEKLGDKGTQHRPDPVFAPVKITKLVDAASPLLFKALCVGAKYEKVHIRQRKAGGHGQHSGAEFWQIDLHDATIENVNWSASESGELMESLSLRYEYLKVTYTPQSHHGALDKPLPPQEHQLQGAEGLKDKDKTKAGAITDAQLTGVVDKVIAELKQRRLIGPGTGSGGTSGHGR